MSDVAAVLSAAVEGDAVPAVLVDGDRVEGVVAVEEVTRGGHATEPANEARAHLAVVETTAGEHYLLGAPVGDDGPAAEAWCKVAEQPAPLESVLERDVLVVGTVAGLELTG